MKAYPIRLTRAWYPGYGYRWYHLDYRFRRRYVTKARPTRPHVPMLKARSKPILKTSAPASKTE